ncbi:tail fiber protein [Pseudomonas phage vB_PaeP_PS28]|nr:tail fiber protein [Pseudomonas phage vB_PaeP_PS28]
MTTKVIFTFHSPDGSPQANEKFTVRLTRPGMSDVEHCVVIPETYEMVTDSNGEFTMDLEAATSAYRVTAVGGDDEYEDDPCSQYTFTFYVPVSDDPIYVQELILMPPPNNLPWDEEAMNKISQAVVDARNARDDAEESAVRAEAQVGLAAEQVELSKDQVDLAKAEVTKATEQVGLAKEEVTKATAQADRSKAEADRSSTQATAAAASAAQAKNEADRSKTEADRSKSEADRARELADGVAEKVEGGSLPPLVGMNETFTYEGTDPYMWESSGPIWRSSEDGVLFVAKTDGSNSRAFLRKDAEFPDGHWIVYLRIRTQNGLPGQNRCAQIRLMEEDNKECSLYFNLGTDNVPTPGVITMQYGYEGASDRTVASMFSPVNTELWMDLAIKYDAVNRHVELFRRLPNATWEKGEGRLMVDALKPVAIEVSSFPVSPKDWWLHLDYISVCKPNLICYGDSIAAGQNEYGVTRGTEDYHSHRNWAGTWFAKAPLYATNRNNLVLVQGVEGRRTWQYLSHLSEISGSGVKVVFLHASTNDVYEPSMTHSKRTSDTQAIVDQLHAVGAQVVLFNSMQGTKAYNDASTGAVKLRDYTDTWWSTELPKVTGLAQTLDIARLLAKDGYMDPVLAADDGLHLTDAAAQKIAAKLGQFFSNSSDTNGFAPLDSPTFTGIPTVPTQTPLLPFGKTIANTEYVVTFLQDWTSRYGYGELSMASHTGAQLSGSGVRSGYYHVPAGSGNPLPGDLSSALAFVDHKSYDTNKGWQLWNPAYTGRLFIRTTNASGVWQTPVELTTFTWLDANNFTKPRTLKFMELPVFNPTGSPTLSGFVPIQDSADGGWRNLSATPTGVALLGAASAGGALNYIGGMPIANQTLPDNNIDNAASNGFQRVPNGTSGLPLNIGDINGHSAITAVFDASIKYQLLFPRTTGVESYSNSVFYRARLDNGWESWVRLLASNQLEGNVTNDLLTSAVFQSNGNNSLNVGRSVRLANGTQIVSATVRLTFASEGILNYTYTYPMGFIEPPALIVQPIEGPGAEINGMPISAVMGPFTYNVANGNALIQCFRVAGYTDTAFASNSFINCSVVAIGRWK